MIRKNKKQLMISSIIILLPAFAGLIIWDKLPEYITTHWGMSGEANGWSGRVAAVFGLPLVMLAAHWLCIWSTARDPRNKDQSSKVFRMVMWIFPLVSLIACGIIYAAALGCTVRIDMASRIFLGIMFVILGNYMPKCKQNFTIGIKVKWALRNEENWNKTHRLAGRLWVAGGVFLLATMFEPLESFMYVYVAVILLLALVPMLYSYIYYRKQLKAGIVTKEDMAASPREKKYMVITLVIMLSAFAFAGVLLFNADFKVQYDDASFTIDATFWSDLTVDYADIDSIEYCVRDISGRRTNGYGSFNLGMGQFENSEFGAYTRYAYTSCNSYVVLSVDDKILVINGEDKEATKDIYDELMERISR